MDLFFFQAEDGIRDRLVTGVQTCALPISGSDTVGLRDWTDLETATRQSAPDSLGSIRPKKPPVLAEVVHHDVVRRHL